MAAVLDWEAVRGVAIGMGKRQADVRVNFG